jgi:hypothetical protein
MSFVFATSHLPEVERPKHAEEEEEHALPLRHSGGVRAFSHLPACRASRAHCDSAQQPRGAAVNPAALGRIGIDDDDPDFVQHVRQAMYGEADESPVAAALLSHVGALPNKVCVKRRERGLSYTSTDKDGHVTVYVNPHEMTGATLSHELGHVVQQAHAYNALQKIHAAGGVPCGADMDEAVMAGRHALHQIVPVVDARDAGQDHKENEAMRISNIVNAERTATGMQGLPEAQRTAAEFWSRQSRKQSAARHQNNQQAMPEGSWYGKYDFHHVKRCLGGGG